MTSAGFEKPADFELADRSVDGATIIDEQLIGEVGCVKLF